ncbi:hypothetical protein [Vibrio crassostreae]|uniref:hypothetical protein n=1 Tax=Vibrio crassostreae TaxID=246167 RepID=UPI001B313051|nr:hypothetical protein [Vibrio crassostreae]
MSDYTTLATLVEDADLTGVTAPDGRSIYTEFADGTTVMLCMESNENFESLREILGLELNNLPALKVRYIKADFWREFGWSEYEGGDFPLSEIDWLNRSCKEWKGTESEYEAWVNEEEGAQSKYEWVDYGTFEEEYPQFIESEHSFEKEVRCIVLQHHGVSDAKAGYWSNWLGDDAKHGQFDCVIRAKDAAKHFDYECFSDHFEWAERFVVEAEEFAERHKETEALLFGFG